MVRLRCPRCGAEDQLEGAAGLWGDPRAEGELTCASCGQAYPVVDGIPMIFVDDHRWRSKQRECEGWEALNLELGQIDYEGIGAPPVDFAIPYIDDEHWAGIAENFDRITRGLDFEGRNVLDVGAGRPWAAKHFALRGARAVAMDVVAHPVVGLGRGWEMMSEAGVTFELLVGDSENMPFASGEFDYVFISAAMHHTNFMRALAREMARVLRPGGTLLVINEPFRSASEDEADLLLSSALPELRHGITERRPSAAEYFRAVADAGLEIAEARLGVDLDDPQRIWDNLTEPGLIPPRQEWFDVTAPRRFARALNTRFRSLPAELELRRALPRGTAGIRGSHAQMMATLFSRSELSIRAVKRPD